MRKFTEDVPREKVLKIESVMDPIDSSEELSDLQVSKDAIIETVAEVVLNQQKPVAVTDADNNVVGGVHSSKMIHVLFGSRAETGNNDYSTTMNQLTNHPKLFQFVGLLVIFALLCLFINPSENNIFWRFPSLIAGLPYLINDSVEYLMFDWWPIQVYDP